MKYIIGTKVWPEEGKDYYYECEDLNESGFSFESHVSLARFHIIRHEAKVTVMGRITNGFKDEVQLYPLYAYGEFLTKHRPYGGGGPGLPVLGIDKMNFDRLKVGTCLAGGPTNLNNRYPAPIEVSLSVVND